jgi:hypothetical protein
MRHASKFIALTIALCGANASVAQRPAEVCAGARSAKAAGSTPGDVTPAEVCRVLSVLAHDSL